MSDSLDTISYAARSRVILKLLGHAGVVLACLQLPPAIAGLITGDYAISLTLLAIAVVLGPLSLALARFSGDDTALPAEVLASVTLTFVLAAAVLWIPFRVAGLAPLDALFDAISAVTTTGLSTLTTVENLPPSILFLRSWAQWYGGLGVIVFALAILTQHPTTARRLAGIGAPSENLGTATQSYARRAAMTYMGLTTVAIVVLLAAGADPLAAFIHAFSAVSTGGFSSFDASLAGFSNPALPFLIAVLCMGGAIPLTLYSELRRGRFNKFFGNEELLALLVMILVVWLLLMLSFQTLGVGLIEAGRRASLLAVFAQTTTGYSVENIGALTGFAKLVLVAAMLIGGGIGSTAGGIKLLRILLCLRLVQLTLQRMRMPAHAVLEYRLGRQKYDERDLLGATTYVLLFFGIVALSWLAFLAAGLDPLDSLFEIVSAIGTVGLSTGMTPELPAVLKLVLAIDMLAGRLEILALLILLHPGLWIGRRLSTQ